VGIAVAQLYLQAPVHLRFGGWEASPPLSLALVVVVIALIVVAFFIKTLAFLLLLPSRMASWGRQRAVTQRQEALAGGVRALALDDSKLALKHFLRLSEDKHSDAGTHAWLAAVAAEKIGDVQKRKHLLRLTANSSPAELAAAAKACLACDEDRLSEAFNILAAAGAPGHSPVLAKMFLDTARRRSEWPAALGAAYQLRTVSPSAKWKKAVIDMVRQGLDTIDDAEKLEDFWKNHVHADERKNAELLSGYIYALHRLGNDKSVADALERAAKTNGEAPEILLVIAALGSRKLCETFFTAGEKGAETSRSAEQVSAIAALAERLNLWGKARRYYQMAHSLRPESRYLQALTELEKKMKSAEAGDS
jgi:uncharacterized protein HemY